MLIKSTSTIEISKDNDMILMITNDTRHYRGTL